MLAEDVMQLAFNRVWDGAEAQGWQKSVMPDDSGTCAYRGLHGLKCHVGHLIPDDLYEGYGNVMEGSGVDDFFDGMTRDDEARLQIGFDRLPASEQNRVVSFLHQLQAAHDETRTVEHRERATKEVAEDHGLDVPS